MRRVTRRLNKVNAGRAKARRWGHVLKIQRTKIEKHWKRGNDESSAFPHA